MRKFSFLIFFSVLIISCSIFRDTKIVGRITGFDQTELIQAHVHLSPLSSISIDETFLTQEVDDIGNFVLEKIKPGAYKLWFTAVDHQSFSLPLIFSRGGKLKIELNLAGYDYKKEFDQVKIIGDWNDFSFSQADTMQQVSDGSYTYSIHSDQDTLFYQLLGIESSGRSLNGTMSDLFKYDQGGDYMSGVVTDSAMVEICFDPQKLDYDDLQQVEFKLDKSHNYIRKMYELDQMYKDFLVNLKDGNYNFNTFAEKIKFLYSNTNSKILKNVILIRLYYYEMHRAYLDEKFHMSDSLVAMIYDRFDPKSMYWSLEPGLCRLISTNLSTRKADKLLQDICEKNSDGNVKAHAKLQSLLIAYYNNQEYREDYKAFIDEFGRRKDFSYYLDQIDPDKMIKAGNSLPKFQIQLLNGMSITEKNLLGRFWLIDFWATWCLPCVKEMPYLHEAYEKYNTKGLNILSISLDRSMADIDNFRKKEWPMPWYHSHLETGFNSEICRIFEVMSIPSPILVSPQGKILSIQGLRGEELANTLELIILE